MHNPRIAYFVHDINDPAVARRVTMLHAAGAAVTVIGFRRDDRLPDRVAGAPVVAVGRTRDNALKQRAAAVLANIVRPAAMLAASADADVLVGRNLEALALAVRARRGRRLVYECLDIHRTLLGTSAPARAIQAVEARLLRAVDLLIVSSPAFLSEYFAHRPLAAPALLVENKLLALGDSSRETPDPPPGPPWTIGWFGNLRCRRSFSQLSALAARLGGRVEILIAGRPSPAVFDDFDVIVGASPHCTYVGPYGVDDLSDLYSRCHFAWGIDYFEEGLNSRWLLPNKLYEAASFGSVPIALAGVETGHWLARHDAGLLLEESAPLDRLTAFFAGLDADGYRPLRDAVRAIPTEDLVADRADCVALLDAVAGR